MAPVTGLVDFSVTFADVGTGKVRFRHEPCRQNVGPLASCANLAELYDWAAAHVEDCPGLNLAGVLYDDGLAIEFPAFTAPGAGFAAATRQLGGEVYLSHLTHEGCPVYRRATPNTRG